MKKYIYLFYDLTDEDKKELKNYNLKYLGKNHFENEVNDVVEGSKEALEDYAENYIGGYELHPDYLYSEEEFAGEIVDESLNEDKNPLTKEEREILKTYKEIEHKDVTIEDDILNSVTDEIQDGFNLKNIEDLKKYIEYLNQIYNILNYLKKEDIDESLNEDDNPKFAFKDWDEFVNKIKDKDIKLIKPIIYIENDIEELEKEDQDKLAKLNYDKDKWNNTIIPEGTKIFITAHSGGENGYIYFKVDSTDGPELFWSKLDLDELADDTNIKDYLTAVNENKPNEYIDSSINEAVKSNSFTPYTAGYILEDGSLLVMDEYHGEEEIREFYPEYSNTHPEEDTCVRLYKKPNDIQYKKLEEIIDYYLDHENYCKVEIWNKPSGKYVLYEIYSLYEGACEDTTWNEKIGNWTGYKLVQIIKNYFAKRVIEGMKAKENISNPLIVKYIEECIAVMKQIKFGFKDEEKILTYNDIDTEEGSTINTFGVMSLPTRGSNNFKLVLNKHMFTEPEEAIKNTIYHELCYYVVSKIAINSKYNTNNQWTGGHRLSIPFDDTITEDIESNDNDESEVKEDSKITSPVNLEDENGYIWAVKLGLKNIDPKDVETLNYDSWDEETTLKYFEYDYNQGYLVKSEFFDYAEIYNEVTEDFVGISYDEYVKLASEGIVPASFEKEEE